MAIISLDKEKLLKAIHQTSQRRFYYALKDTGLQPLFKQRRSLPTKLRKVLLWAQLEKWLPSALINFSYIGFGFLYLLVENESLHWLFAILLGSPLLLLTAFTVYIHTTTWAKTRVQKLLDTPFLFVLNGDIYENSPNLRTLNDEITVLKQNQIETQHSIQKIQKISRDMKEQLILLGQNTMDPYLRDLESQRTTQLRLLEQSQHLLQMSKKSQQEQLKLQEELLMWAELDRLRQQASQISGNESKRESWQKMTTLELQAAELAFQMHDLNQQLRNTLAHRSAENEILQI
jgi:hypothetical protein